jgi:hypothetical protein
MSNLLTQQISDAVALTLKATVDMDEKLADLNGQMKSIPSGQLLMTTHLITIALLREIRDELKRLVDSQG